MRTRIVLSLGFVVFFGTSLLRADPWLSLWDTGVGSGFDSPQAMDVDATGSIYITGSNSESQFTVKYTPSREKIWDNPLETFGGLSESSLLTSPDGSFYVGGHLDDCNGNTCAKRLVASKLDAGGSALWKVTYDLPQDTYLQSFNMKVSPSGKLYLTTS